MDLNPTLLTYFDLTYNEDLLNDVVAKNKNKIAAILCFSFWLPISLK